MTNLLDLSKPELNAFFDRLGEPAFRAKQALQWLWQKGEGEFAAMSNLSKDLRERLSAAAVVRRPEVVDVLTSVDGTTKLLLKLGDEALVETVLIPDDDRVTQCLSTQVGCAMGCVFCATGKLGFTRNMTAGEICAQVLVGRDHLRAHGRGELTNLVFMGMGEPLHNLEALTGSLEIITDDFGLGFSARRSTVSTVGLPGGGIRKLGETGLCSLAVSLHAPTQELREQLMPAAAKALPLPELMAELDAYPMKNRQRITYEYILLRGVNDSPAHARQLVKLLGQRKCKVNLIAFNSAPGSVHDTCFAAPDMETVLEFEDILRAKGLTCILRKSKGSDIAAACGQLAGRRATDERPTEKGTAYADA